MKLVQMNLRVPPTVKEWIQNEADKDDRSGGYFLSKLLEKYHMKKIKEVNKVESKVTGWRDVEKLLIYLNEISGRQFKTSTDLAARLKEGYAPKDIARVIKYKCQEWMGTPSQKYIRPSTLFNKTKFEGYINDANQGVPNEKSGTTNQPSPVQPKLSAGQRIRAAAEERDRRLMGGNGGDVRAKVDQQLRGGAGSVGNVGSVIDGDYTRAD